jgi:hypothetical protein
MGAPIRWSDAPKEDVLAELGRILESHHFRTSKKCSRFFRHIVEAALAGHFESLKERTLGIDVFEREPDYDTNQDPVVRGTAGEVRKRLAQYYLEAEDGKLRLGLPAGSYVPELHSTALERPKLIPAAQPPRERAVRRHSRIPPLVVGGSLCALAAISVWLLLRPTNLDRFWGPALSGKSVLVCMGQPQYYTFHFNTAQVLNSWFADGVDSGKAPPINSVPLHEIVPMWDKSVALADAQAFSRLVNLFARRRRQVDLRGDRLVSLSDLRSQPSVLIGAFNNDWTLNLTGELRFYFYMDPTTRVQMIRDHQKPAETDWKLVDAWPPGKDIVEDYALVTRVVNRTTERTTIVLGGISQYGTEAAAEFVTEPAYFARALTNAPADWYRKNIQVVLSTKVLSGVSGPPTVVATYFW